MYEAFYKLTGKPFQLTPDPRFFYNSRGHKRALAYLRYGKAAAVDYIRTEGLLMAPAYSVSNMLADARLGFADFDLFEIHEAFAAQTLATLKAWESAEYCREWLGRAGAGQYRRAGLKARDGRQGGSVQEVCQYRLL